MSKWEWMCKRVMFSGQFLVFRISSGFQFSRYASFIKLLYKDISVRRKDPRLSPEHLERGSSYYMGSQILLRYSMTFLSSKSMLGLKVCRSNICFPFNSRTCIVLYSGVLSVVNVEQFILQLFTSRSFLSNMLQGS